MQDDDLEPPVDLQALRLDPERFESLARRIESAAGRELRRRADGDVPQALARAMWPALVAAAAAVVVVVGLGRTGAQEGETGLAASGIEHVIPGKTTDVGWIEEQRAPDNDDLVQALGLGGTP